MTTHQYNVVLNYDEEVVRKEIIVQAVNKLLSRSFDLIYADIFVKVGARVDEILKKDLDTHLQPQIDKLFNPEQMGHFVGMLEQRVQTKFSSVMDSADYIFQKYLSNAIHEELEKRNEAILHAIRVKLLKFLAEEVNNEPTT